MACEYHENFDSATVAAAGALDRTAQPCLFDRMSWYRALLPIAFPGRAPLLACARDGAAQAWLALVEEKRGDARALANWYSFSWSPVFTHVRDDGQKLTLLRALADLLGQRCWRIILSQVPAEGGADSMAGLIEAAFGQAGWLCLREPCDTNHVLAVAGRDFDSYWQGRPGALRSTIRRKGAGGRVAIAIHDRFDADRWAEYEHVYAKSWKPAESSPDFLRALARQEGEAGALRLGLAHIDGQPVAAQFWTVEQGRALIHKLAHDPAHDAASPGSLLTAAMLRHAIDVDKVDLVDFGTGNDRYKSDWMEEVRPRDQLTLLRPWHPRAWPVIARNRLKTALHRD